MASLLDVTIDPGPRRLRMETLTQLRWFAVGGQILTIIIASGVVGVDVPIAICAALVALPIFLNFFIRSRFPSSVRLTQRQALALLLFDVGQLGLLLYFTGGLENPFALLLLISVLVSAASLTVQATLLLGAVVLAIASALSVFHQPLPWYPGEVLDLPIAYKIGIWLGIVSGLVFMTIYTWRITEENRELNEAFTATELVVAREQHLSALDGMAAAAAHALGTPLSTIAVVARELERATPEDHPSFEDIRLIKAQSDRCRDVLRKLTALELDADTLEFEEIPLKTLLQELAAPYLSTGVAIEIAVNPDEGDDTEVGPDTVRNPAIVYSLGNIVENAVEFAAGKVQLIAAVSPTEVVLSIVDDGPGFPTEVMDRLGEPYVTSRKGLKAHANSSEGAGLGLGFFIAKTILERSGASLSFKNKRRPERGAMVTIRWLIDTFQRGRLDVRSELIH
ncbi:MAG: ActS/PrrB/RegB family redox-sensitive histidine kinase [Pseudomonadota bacterium]